jgi:hypothetical protein
MQVRHPYAPRAPGTAPAAEQARAQGHESGRDDADSESGQDKSALNQMKDWLKDKMNTVLDQTEISVGHARSPKTVPHAPQLKQMAPWRLTVPVLPSVVATSFQQVVTGAVGDGTGVATGDGNGRGAQQTWQQAGGRVMQDGAPGEAVAPKCLSIPEASMVAVVGDSYQVRPCPRW